ncbi:hypothetical protein SAMN05421788_11819 [Filimonas lacunae]|uniref:Uncharacterized protein n=1 Tax=Filimonas lacunae TaxID=477680 RepID=A0A1N7RHY9_9BACT|nr:YfhO family protein [Filimonas lacunae]SIT34652.1 hypothetical protein SAMN05421788_11819 [Filimonas lacunae]
MPRLLLLFVPLAFLFGFFIAIMAEQRKGIARLLVAVTIIFLFLAMTLALMPEIKTFVWLSNFVLIVSWLACFATIIKYYRANSSEPLKAWLVVIALIAVVSTFTLANDNVQKNIKWMFCSYVECNDEVARLVDVNIELVNANKDSTSVLQKGEKYNLVMSDSFYYETGRLMKVMPTSRALEKDSVARITLAVWRNNKKIRSLNEYITRADRELDEYKQFESLNDIRYDSLGDWKRVYNKAIDDEFQGDELGRDGLKFELTLPQDSPLSGAYDMRLDIVFSSKKRLSSVRQIHIK